MHNNQQIRLGTSIIAHSLLRAPSQQWTATPQDPPLQLVTRGNEKPYEILKMELVQAPPTATDPSSYSLLCTTTDSVVPVITLTLENKHKVSFRLSNTKRQHSLKPLIATISLNNGCIGFPSDKQISLLTPTYTCTLFETTQLLQRHIPDIPPDCLTTWPHPLTITYILHWPRPNQPTPLEIAYQFYNNDMKGLGFQPEYLETTSISPDIAQPAPLHLYTFRNNVALTYLLPLLDSCATLIIQNNLPVLAGPLNKLHPAIYLLPLYKLYLLYAPPGPAPHLTPYPEQPPLLSTISSLMPQLLYVPPVNNPNEQTRSLPNMLKILQDCLQQQQMAHLSC